MFAKRLKKLRMSKNISQAKLASKLSFSQQTIAKWETEQSTPNPDILVKIADFFNVSTDYLLGNDDNKIKLQTSLSPEAERLIKKLENTDETTIAELEQYLNYLESKKNLKKTSSDK